MQIRQLGKNGQKVSASRKHPRFQGENFEKNQSIAGKVTELAEEKKCKPAQLAIAWVLSKGKDIVPIPGTKRVKYLEENAHALSMRFIPEELDTMNELFPPGVAAGDRYSEGGM